MMGMVAALLIFLAGAQKRKVKALKSLSGVLNGGFGYRRLFLPGFRGHCDGLPFAVELLPGGRNTPPKLLISIAAVPSFRLKIYKESFIYSIGKKLGFMRDMETCDPMFNQEFIISTDSESMAAPYLNDSQRRQDIWELMNSGFKDFVIGKDKVMLIKPRYVIETDLQPQTVAGIVKKLTNLTKAACH